MPDTGDNVCNICHESESLLSVGICDHHVCYKCSTRMRVLMGHQYCPICRTELPKIIFSRKKLRFVDIAAKASPELDDSRYGISFEDKFAREAFEKLLSHFCTTCKDCQSKPFGTFDKLQEHVRKVHQLFYCDICVDQLKLFSFERKSYTRTDLALHRRKGDPDDTSHKGHPLCEYCDKRFLDSDELWRHLRKDHYFCHFCDADGNHSFFNTYDHVLVHFREEHFVCEEGECASVQFTNVFRTDIDLRAHKTQQHLKHLSKSEQKQVRTLELQFNFGPLRHRSAGGSGADHSGPVVGDDRPKRGGSSNSSRGVSKSTPEEDQLAVAVRMSTQSHEVQHSREAEPLQFSTDDFPDLGAGGASRLGASSTTAHQQHAAAAADGASGSVGRAPVAASNSMAKRFARMNKFTVVEDDSVDGTENHFPALPSAAATPAGRPMPSAQAARPQQARGRPVASAAAAASSSMSTTAAASVKKNAWSSLDDEFPALPPSSGPGSTTAASAPAGWTKVPKGKAKRDSMSSQKSQQQRRQQGMPAESSDDFPCLSDLAAELAVGATLPSGQWAAKDGPTVPAAAATAAGQKGAGKGLNRGEQPGRSNAGSAAAVTAVTAAAATSDSGVQSKNKGKKKKKKGTAIDEGRDETDELRKQQQQKPASDAATVAVGAQQRGGGGRGTPEVSGLSQQPPRPAAAAAATAGCTTALAATTPSNAVAAVGRARAGPTSGTSSASGGSNSSSGTSEQVPKAVESREAWAAAAEAAAADPFPALPTARRQCGPPPGFVSPAEPAVRPPPGLAVGSAVPAAPSSLADIASFISPQVVPALARNGARSSSAVPPPPGLAFTVPAAHPPDLELLLAAAGQQQRGVVERAPTTGPSAVQRQRVGLASAPDGVAAHQPRLAFDKPGDYDVRSSERASSLRGIVADDPGKLDPSVALTSRSAFVKPNDFDVRNVELTRLLKSIVADDPGKLDSFVTLTSRFRGSLLGPRDFYECCLGLLGEVAFARLFPELLVLLPDTVRQCELLAAHTAFVAETDGSRTALAALSTDELFVTCQACGQVLARGRDEAAHERYHAAAARFDMAEQVADFPPLSAAEGGSGGGGVLRSWARKN